MSFQLIDCEDKGLWDSFVASSPQGSVFCRSWFLDAHDTPYRLVFVEEESRPLLAAIVFPEKTGGHLTQNPLTMYQGVMLSRHLTTMPVHSRVSKTIKLVTFLVEYLEKQYDSVYFCLHHTFPDVRSFSWFHYHKREQGTFRIDVRYSGLLDVTQVCDMRSYLSSVRTLRRREVRKADLAGWSVMPSRDVDLLERLHNTTFTRQGLSVENKLSRMLRAIAGAGLDNSSAELLVCRHTTGAVSSATLFLFDDQCGYYLIGANDPAFRNTGASTRLMLANLERCRKRGLQVVDMVGLNSPNRGDYKTSFNAVPTPYCTVRWDRPN